MGSCRMETRQEDEQSSPSPHRKWIGPLACRHIASTVQKILRSRLTTSAGPIRGCLGTATHKRATDLLARANRRTPGRYLESLLSGASGQTWRLIKWAWNSAEETLSDLIAGCIRAGHHPLIWRQAIVCAVPKPHRPDYSLAKNFRPVSLLECMGKLVEKLMARLLYSEIIRFDLLPTNQFGGRMASSTLDAGLSLVHDVKVAHCAGLRTGLLLFDIQGFFDNINREHLTQTIADLGFAQEIVDWTSAFLSDRTVRLKFNKHTSDPFSSEVGTPQGSPISPVLSVLYTHALLRITQETKWTALSMYIDDGAILACGKTWDKVESSLKKAYSSCALWLHRAGLKVEPDKTEVMYFRRRFEKEDPPGNISLPHHPQHTSYEVKAVHCLRYLGFFIDHKLNWTHHVNTMCNRT